MATYGFISELLRESDIACDWQPRGAVAAFYSQADFDRALDKFDRSRVDAPEIVDHLQVVGPNSTAPSLGDLGVGKAKGAIINTMAASLWPYKLVARIVQDQVQERADFSLHTNTPVTSLETATGDADGPWRVCTPRGSCIARHVLLATNGYTSHLLPNMRDVIEPVRGNMIAGRGGGDLLLNHSYGLVDELSGDEHKDLIRVSERLIGDGEYLMQRPAERGAAGLGTIAESPVLALGGARFMMPNSGYGLSNDDRLDPEANKFLRGRLAQVLDAVAAEPETFKVTHEWTGILGYSKDGFPWVGELREGLWLCAGYSGHGMPQAALCATSVASMILDRLAGHDRDLSKDRGVLPSRFMITPERLKAHGL
ncbi:FAD dependent oxidoreductase [Purpureocillium lavendulum]|uniref:FAD dependent oxidoreductase n=1 Tax=Purpureocillium lavendulum TaxID=1247861 RepID=A0AB34FF34_9HYPO|nr:FAD dependent oxidoreductase [Purpureocillium lavendulum]